VLAIAHNGNLSNGIMFPVVESFTGKPVDLEYAKTRARWEPLYEVTQIKGDGEAHPFLSANDEFADYETWDQGKLDLSVAKKPDMLQNEYARSALKIGLELEKKLGVNASWSNTIGAPELITVLKDPDFDPSLRAFYYARVIEIPTPRWTAYDAMRYGITMPPEVPMITQERAYTSPIWYTPG
jgi:hypothetical protein